MASWGTIAANLKDHFVKTLSHHRSKGRHYVDLREDNEKMFFYCILCRENFDGVSSLCNHLKGSQCSKRQESAKTTLMKTNPWPFLDGEVLFHTEPKEQLKCLPASEADRTELINAYHVDAKSFSIVIGPTTMVVKHVGVGRIGAMCCQKNGDVLRIWCEWVGNKGLANEEDIEVVAQHKFSVVTFTYNNNLGLGGGVTSGRVCDICNNELLSDKDVAALLNRSTGKLVCRSRNRTGRFHLYHVSCLIYWIMLFEVEANANWKLYNTHNKLVECVVCPDCQGTGIEVDGEGLEKPMISLDKMSGYKKKLWEAYHAWMENPEELQNCSLGLSFPEYDDAWMEGLQNYCSTDFSFPPQTYDEQCQLKENVAKRILLNFYRASATSAANLKDHFVKTLSHHRSKGRHYVDLREDNEKMLFYCILCRENFDGVSSLCNHLKGSQCSKRQESAKTTLMKTNPWPFLDGEVLFHTEPKEQLKCLPASEADQTELINAHHVDAKSFSIVDGPTTMVVKHVGVGRIGAMCCQKNGDVLRIWCEWVGNKGLANEEDIDVVAQHKFSVVTFTYNNGLGLGGGVTSGRVCDICHHELLSDKDVAALLNRSTGKLVCRSRNQTGRFHLYHVSCLIYWIMLFEVEANANWKLYNTHNKLVECVVCPDCQGTGIEVDGKGLEKLMFSVFEMSGYKKKLWEAYHAWMENPEELQNCSLGLSFPEYDDAWMEGLQNYCSTDFSFPPQTYDEQYQLKENVAKRILLNFYRASAN